MMEFECSLKALVKNYIKQEGLKHAMKQSILAHFLHNCTTLRVEFATLESAFIDS